MFRGKNWLQGGWWCGGPNCSSSTTGNVYFLNNKISGPARSSLSHHVVPSSTTLVTRRPEESHWDNVWKFQQSRLTLVFNSNPHFSLLLCPFGGKFCFEKFQNKSKIRKLSEVVDTEGRERERCVPKDCTILLQTNLNPCRILENRRNFYKFSWKLQLLKSLHYLKVSRSSYIHIIYNFSYFLILLGFK